MKDLHDMARTIIYEQHRMSWREAMIQRIISIDMLPGDKLELRVSGKSNEHILSLARRAASMFLSVFMFYPTSLAMHAANAALCEAAEEVIKASPVHHSDLIMMMLGEDFTATPLHIEIDDSLGLHSVAVRFSIDSDGPAFQQALKNSLMRTLRQKKQQARSNQQWNNG